MVKPATMPPYTAILACRVLEDEVRHFAAGWPHLVHFEFFNMGLHDRPDVLRATLTEALARAESQPQVEAIALVYGVCGFGTIGLEPRRCQLVIPRAHDCITLLLGSKERYAALMQRSPGLHWYSPGWVRERRVPGPDRDAALRAEYTAKFGKEEADALLAEERDRLAPHACAACTGLNLPGCAEVHAYALRCAAWLGWPCVEHPGDASLLRDLLAGRWDKDRFLVIGPGERTAFSPDIAVLKAVATGP